MISLTRLLPVSASSAASRAASAPPRISVGLILLLGLVWRCTDHNEWPFPYAPTVQYESALAARWIWVKIDPAANSPERSAWAQTPDHWHIVSPPVLPGLSAICYMIAGEEIPWVSKLIGAAFWTAAGWFLHRAILLQTGSGWAVIAGLAYFTFCPFGLVICRSFMTEPVMMFGFSVAIWRLSSWNGDSPWRNTLTAGFVCGVAAAGKPGVLLPPLAAAFGLMALSATSGWWRKITRIATFTALLALPSFAYAMLVLNHRGGELNPGLLLTADFYRAVATIVRAELGGPALGLGFLGIAVAARARAFLPIGLLGGYFGYAGLFTFHCSTHNYYHLPLALILALGIGWLGAAVEKRLPGFGLDPSRVRLVIATLAVFAYIWFSRLPWIGPWRYSPEVQAATQRLEEQERLVAERDRRIEAILGPRAKVVALTEHFGFPLECHTMMSVVFFFDLPDDLETRLERWKAEGCEYLVITDFASYAEMPGLRAAVARRRIIHSESGLLVVSLSVK